MQRQMTESGTRSAPFHWSPRLGIVGMAVGALIAGCGGSGGSSNVPFIPPVQTQPQPQPQPETQPEVEPQPEATTSKVPNPVVTGPIAKGAMPGTAQGHKEHDYPWLATMHNLAAVGYVEEEYFIEGNANTYNFPASYSAANSATTVGVPATVATTGNRYKTRILVRRPASADKFNGTVIAEWQNVTAGYDLDALWGSGFEHMIREGYVYVGISAQPVGVNQLKKWSAKADGFSGRYDSLDVGGSSSTLGNAISHDVFLQALQAIRYPGKGINPLGPLRAKKMIVTGVSQSGGYLQRIINSLDPIYGNARTPDNKGPIDSYMVYIAGGYLNRNLAVPVWKVISETDVAGQVASRPTGTDEAGNYRSWEVAGATHSGRRTALNSRPLAARDDWPLTGVDCVYPVHPRVPVQHVTNAVYDHLVKWMDNPSYNPPRMPAILTSGTTIVRDTTPGHEDKNSQGGVRLPEMLVPTAWNAGTGNSARPGGEGGTFCSLYGSYYPFSPAYTEQLYPSRGQYTDLVSLAIDDSVKAGILVPEDARHTKFVADRLEFDGGTTRPENTAAYMAAQDLLEITYFYLWTTPDQLDAYMDQAARIAKNVALADKSSGSQFVYDSIRNDLKSYADGVEALRKAGKVSDVSAKELADGVRLVMDGLPAL